MKLTLYRNCILTAAALVLPGCLAINAVLGVMGYLGSVPAQLAGTIYSVSEYTYEYAVNDKTPDEVIEEKFAWLIPPEESPEISDYAKAFRKSVSSSPMADIDTEVQLADSTPGVPQAMPPVSQKQENGVPAITASLNLASQKTTAAAKPKKVQRQRRVKKKPIPTTVAAKTTAPRPLPQPAFKERKTDPLLARLDRLEQAFRQAEEIVSSEPSQGLLLSVQSDDTDLTSQGINGSWSIRHGLMKHGPPVSRNAVTDAGLPPATKHHVS